MEKVRSLKIWVMAALLVVLPLASWGAAENAALTTVKTTARTELWKDITSGKTGSATVAVMDKGVIVYAEGFGMADREHSIPVDKNTLFNMGSISKVYCATAIMLLVDEGKVKLDAPVTVYLPEFSMLDERYRDITVRMLLNHSSGLPGTVGPNSFGFQYHPDFYQDVLDIMSQSHLKHQPGELAPYCNDGFTIAEMIVAKVSGQKYFDFLQQRIFTPLSLTYTGGSVAERPEKNLVAAQDYTTAGKALPLEALSMLGSGGLSATAEDVCRFVDSFSLDGRHILSAAALSEMRKVQGSEFAGKLRNPDISFGLGWDFAEIPSLKSKGIDVLGKSGATGEYNSMVFTVPSQRITVAVILTGPHGRAMDLAYSLLKTYVTEKGLIDKDPVTVVTPLQGEPIPTELADYAGYYSNGNSLSRISFDLSANCLNIHNTEGNQEIKALSAVYNGGYFHDSSTKYYFTVVDGRVVFVKHWGNFNIDVISAEKVEKLTAPGQLAADIDNRQWLRRNAKAYEGPDSEGYVFTSRLIPDLPGYIDFAGIKKVTGPTTAGYPISSMRDLTELSITEQNGVAWAWISGMLYSSTDAAATLTGNMATLTIGSKGYNEWLNLKQEAVLSFAKPANGRVFVFAADGTPIYDSVVDNGEVFVAAGAWVAVAGQAGDSFSVQVKTR